jgi:hypothetical protein
MQFDFIGSGEGQIDRNGVCHGTAVQWASPRYSAVFPDSRRIHDSDMIPRNPEKEYGDARPRICDVCLEVDPLQSTLLEYSTPLFRSDATATEPPLDAKGTIWSIGSYPDNYSLSIR